MTAPANDNFADAEVLSGLGQLVTGLDTTDATFELDEPNVTDETWPDPPYTYWGSYDTYIGKTVWFTWSPGTAGSFELTTEGSDFDTVVAVYTASGTTFADLTLVGANDQQFVDLEGNDPFDWSRLKFTGDPAETYFIQVGGYSGQSGSLSMSVSAIVPPVNDDWANASAITLSGGSATVTGTSNHATTEAGEPLTFSFFGYSGTVANTVWWEWTAPADGVATFDTFGSDYDTTAAAFAGGSVAGLTCLAFNDNYEGGSVTIDQSEVAWAAEEAETYYLQVASSGSLVFGSVAAHLYFDAYATGGSADPAWDSGTADAYRVELRELNSAGFAVTTASLELVSFSCNWRLNAPGAFEGTGVKGVTQADASNVGARELIVYKGATAIWGGYLTFFDIDEDTKQVRVGAEGYWSRARARLIRGNQIYKPLTNSGVAWKADQIAWDIIDQAQGATYGDMGWVYGGHSGTRKNCKRTYYGVDRNNIGEAIEALAREGYFDFSVDVRAIPEEDDVAQFRTWYERGTNRTSTVNLSSSNAMTLNYSLSSSDMATVIDVFGSVEGCRGVAATDDANLATYGRLEARPIDMETDEQDEVDAAAERFIDQHGVPAKNATATYLEGVGPDLTDYDLGDTIRISPADGYVSSFDGRVVAREVAVEAGRAVITVEVER